MDKKIPNDEFKYSELIRFVKDRPGHDKRYSINSDKITKELNWKSSIQFEDGISKTVTWYLNNQKDIFNMENGKS